jgi:hypothetical protein
MLPDSLASVEEVGMMEKNVTAPQHLDGSTLHTGVKPFEIKTIRIDYSDDNSGVW